MVYGATLGGLLACAPRKAPEIPLPPEVTLYVSVSDQVAKNDTGTVASMVLTVEEELRDAGYTVSIVAARDDEPAPEPRVELQVRTSDPADKEALAGGQLISSLGGLAGVAGVVVIGANGSIEVDAFFVAPRPRPPKYLGRFSASSFMSMATDDPDTVAGERAGGQIARRLLQPAGYVSHAAR